MPPTPKCPVCLGQLWVPPWFQAAARLGQRVSLASENKSDSWEEAVFLLLESEEGKFPSLEEGNLERLLNCCGRLGDSERRQAWRKVGFSPQAGAHCAEGGL